MRNRILILVLLFAVIFGLSVRAAQPADEVYQLLQRLSALNLNIYSPTPADSLIRLCRQAEVSARVSEDVLREFKAGQVLVNTYALTGKAALAVNKAQDLVHEARAKNNPIALGLAMQAIGDTYLFAGHFTQADSVFHEASPIIRQFGDAYCQTELILQRLHVHLHLQRTEQAAEDIAQLHNLFQTADAGAGAEIYRLLTKSYEALAAIQLLDSKSARQLIRQIALERPSDGTLDLWYYYLRAQFHTLEANYADALIYSDSTLIVAHEGHNDNILRQALISKAELFEKIGLYEEACDLYAEVSELNNSLHETQYLSQIDSLHVTYLIDQLLMANLTQRNELYTYVIIGLLILVAITIAVVLLVKRRNGALKRSKRELEAMREASDDSLRTKSLFLSNMSHELRTPLNALTGFSTILTDYENIDDQTRRQYSDYISQNAELLLKLINDVVDLSELKGNSIRFVYAPCDVVALCRNVIKTVDNVKRSMAQINFETNLERLEIETDGARLQQVLINLLINATKFTPKGTITLRLELDKAASQVIFTVEDTGCGIPAEKQNSIFERFEKLHEGVQGTGLGLSICQLIVNHTGGRIWIDPNYTQGARFVFTHPLNAQNIQKQ